VQVFARRLQVFLVVGGLAYIGLGVVDAAVPIGLLGIPRDNRGGRGLLGLRRSVRD
jgi:hypothetical protein